jgi:hypothetical protein
VECFRWRTIYTLFFNGCTEVGNAHSIYAGKLEVDSDEGLLGSETEASLSSLQRRPPSAISRSSSQSRRSLWRWPTGQTKTPSFTGSTTHSRTESEGYQDHANFSYDDEVGAGSGATRYLKNLDCIANAVDEPPKMHLFSSIFKDNTGYCMLCTQ